MVRRLAARRVVPVWLLAGLLVGPAAAHAGAPATSTGRVDPSVLREADLVFQTSRSSQSAAVALATRSRYTHMGIVVLEDGAPFVYEAVGPVKRTPFADWVARGEDGHVVVKRLATPPGPEALRRMRAVAASFDGKPYDLRFRWDDSALYCSELVYKIYREGAGIEIGSLAPAKSFDLSSPEVQKKIRERFGKSAPFDPDEPVISPQSMFDDPDLVTVFENGPEARGRETGGAGSGSIDR